MELIKLILEGKVCPYCAKDTEYVDSKVIYGTSYGMIYRCEPCGAHVGTHKKNGEALGSLANGTLRQARKDAHKHFDPMWKKAVEAGKAKDEARGSAYKWLSSKTSIPPELCHIGMMTEDQCELVINACKPYLNN